MTPVHYYYNTDRHSPINISACLPCEFNVFLLGNALANNEITEARFNCDGEAARRAVLLIYVQHGSVGVIRARATKGREYQ